MARHRSFGGLVAYLDEEEAYGYPHQLADAGEQAGEHSVGAADVQDVGDEGEASLAGAHLHGDEEEEVGEEGGEGLYEHAVPVGDVAGEDEEDEHYLDAAQQPRAELEGEAEVERGAPLGVERGDLRVDVAEGVGVAVGEAAYAAAEEGESGEEAHGAHGEPVAVSLHEEVDAEGAEQGHEREDAEEGRVERGEVERDKEEDGEGPEAEVGEYVGHGVEDDAAGGLGGSHAAAELHDAVWLAAKQAHRGNVVERVA